MSTAAPATPAPRSVNTAYWLYLVGAILGVVGIVITLVAIPASIAATQAQLERTGQNAAQSVVQGLVIGGAVFGIVVQVVLIVLEVVFVRFFRRGRNWARIVLTVLAGLQVFGVAGSLFFGFVEFAVLVVAIVFSWLPTSNAWFRAVNPRAATAV